jgi:hypothetical protein
VGCCVGFGTDVAGIVEYALVCTVKLIDLWEISAEKPIRRHILHYFVNNLVVCWSVEIISTIFVGIGVGLG